MHYRGNDSNGHIAALDSCLLDITERFPEVHIVCCGDFNARTANIQINNHPTDLSTSPRNSVPLFQYSKSSCDGTINDFGERLLDFCACFDLLILNGCKQGDEKGHFTYVSTHGCSVIDYCLVSDSFVDRVAKFAVCDRVESQHMPILFEITCAQGQNAATVTHPVERVVWHRDKIQGFIENIQGDSFKEKIAHATEEIEKCIDKALGELTDCLMNASACMRKKTNSGQYKTGW